MEPTHALYVIDNWDGEGDQYWTFAYLKESVFYCYERDKPVLEYIGDKILKQVILNQE